MGAFDRETEFPCADFLDFKGRSQFLRVILFGFGFFLAWKEVVVSEVSQSFLLFDDLIFDNLPVSTKAVSTKAVSTILFR